MTEAFPPCWHKEIDDEGFCKGCGERAAITINITKPNRELYSSLDDHRFGQPEDNRGAAVPDCSTCGKPSPYGDPCRKCVARRKAMSGESRAEFERDRFGTAGPVKECADCGEEVKTDDCCSYCGIPLHPDAPKGQQGRCTSNHENECDQNPEGE